MGGNVTKSNRGVAAALPPERLLAQHRQPAGECDAQPGLPGLRWRKRHYSLALKVSRVPFLTVTIQSLASPLMLPSPLMIAGDV